MFLSIGKRIARLSTDYPMLHTANAHQLKQTVCEQPVDLQAVVITTPLIMTHL